MAGTLSLSWPGSGLRSRDELASCSLGRPESRHGCQFLSRGLPVSRTDNRGKVCCAATQVSSPLIADEAEKLVKEAHKYFDQVVITVRSGDGGHGSVLEMPADPMPARYARGDKYEKHKQVEKPEKGKKKVGAFKRGPDGSLDLPMGGHGGDVILVADERIDTLLDLHKKKRYNAKRGSNVNASGSLTPMLRDGLSATSVYIPVPVGTVVKRKKGGKLVADLTRAGDTYLAARGGQGGISMLELPKKNLKPLKNVSNALITDPEDKVLTLGSIGEEVVLELTLRVVADVGLVGLPNAGKSSLLAAVTRAKPEIADYPFTTLMPNLGRLLGDTENEDGGFASGATLADLPGLIKGAHLGKGLGRMFLRHLRRTRLMLHVVDTSADDPVCDYRTLREELYMYNPEYGRRPHIVVLNKLDLPKASESFPAIRETIANLGVEPEMVPLSRERKPHLSSRLSLLERDSSVVVNESTAADGGGVGDSTDNENSRGVEQFRRPLAVLGISAKQGLGMGVLLECIGEALQREESKVVMKPRNSERLQLYKAPQWKI